MLSQIESKLEYLLAAIQDVDPEVIKKLENAQEKARRKELRDKRNKERLERKDKEKKRTKVTSTGPVKKRVGKPLMSRSEPIETKNDNVQTKKDDKKSNDTANPTATDQQPASTTNNASIGKNMFGIMSQDKASQEELFQKLFGSSFK